MGSTKEGSKHSAPSFTMAARAREDEDKMKVPGPGSYDDATVDKYKALKSPCFSMGQRTTIPSDHTMKPGPGAHCPEKVLYYIVHAGINESGKAFGYEVLLIQ